MQAQTVHVTLATRTGCPNPQPVTLVKEPTNAYDSEAIKVLDAKDNLIGYVSTTYKTRKPNTISGGRIYDRISDSHPAAIISPFIIELTLSA